MIQNSLIKYKKLKSNLAQSENLTQNLKTELLKLGSETNFLLITITSITSQIQQFRSLLPKMSKQLNSIKEDHKRISYKTQKMEIKQNQYEQRVNKFQLLFEQKKQKSEILTAKISKLEAKILEEKQKKTQILKEFDYFQSNPQLKLQSSKDESLNPLLKRSSVGFNPCDEVELELLTSQSKVKKLKQQKQEIIAKNLTLKSKISKIELKTQQISLFLSQNSYIPNFNQLLVETTKKEAQEKKYQSQKKNSLNRMDNIIFFDQQDLKNTNLVQCNRLPTHISSSFSGFQKMKSKTMLNPLIEKHSQIIKLQQAYVESLQQSYALISQLNKINFALESEVVQQNAKISSFSIRSKKITEKHKKNLS